MKSIIDAARAGAAAAWAVLKKPLIAAVAAFVTGFMAALNLDGFAPSVIEMLAPLLSLLN